MGRYALTETEYEILFDSETGITYPHKGGYRTKTIISGNIREVMIYPVWDRSQDAGRAKKQVSQKHAEAVRRIHQRNKQKQLERLINTNFKPDDILLTLTNENNSLSEEDAAKQIRNYLRRVKRKREKQGLEELKYIYTTEVTHGEKGTRYHHHLIMNKGLTGDELQGMWKHGITNARRAKDMPEGLSGWANYMSKQKATQEKAMKHGWACSLNLKQPTVTVADKKVSMHQAMQIAEDMELYGSAILQRINPDYDLLEAPRVKWSDMVAGVYITARLKRRTL